MLLKRKGHCFYCNRENVYQRAVVKCTRCFWHDGYKICPICVHQIPVDRKHSVDGFILVFILSWYADCHTVKHIDSETLKKIHYPPSEDEDDWFGVKHFVVVVIFVLNKFISNLCVFESFLSLSVKNNKVS